MNHGLSRSSSGHVVQWLQNLISWWTSKLAGRWMFIPTKGNGDVWCYDGYGFRIHRPPFWGCWNIYQQPTEFCGSAGATSFTEIVKWLKDLVNMFFVFKGVDQSTSEKSRILKRTSPLRATTLRFLPTEIGWEMLISHELTAKSGGFSHGLNQQQEHSRPIFYAYWPAHRHEFSPKERTCVWAEIYYARHSYTHTHLHLGNNMQQLSSLLLLRGLSSVGDQQSSRRAWNLALFHRTG